LHSWRLIVAIARDGNPGLRSGRPTGTEVTRWHTFRKPL